MKRISAAFFQFVTAFLLLFAVVAPAAAGGLDDFAKDFSMPPLIYGSAPFWSWDEKMEKDELGFQADEYAKQGVGGAFIHARIGRITEYMSKEWLDLVKFSVDRAKKDNMLIYLYDEDRWPSGFAGGIVPAQSKNFHQKGLTLVESEKPLEAPEFPRESEIIRVFLVETKDGSLVSWKDVTPAPGAKPSAPPKGSELAYFFKIYADTREWFNDQSYIDTMLPEAVKAFIDSTYEAYKSAVGDEFGKTVPAIFTDEPSLLEKNDFPPGTIPWTEALPESFKKSYGYDIRDRLPLLYWQSPEAAKARVDFWTQATNMFTNAFGKQIFEWCERNNIKFTGHYMCEDNLVVQTQWIGAAMPHYEYMQMPGIDHLGRNINDVLTAKQASSAAHQFGRPLVLSEMYGCAGWNFSFDGMKWIADWHYALGVNFVNQHLSWYTMRGCRKRDYPTCIQYQSPWWKYHKVVGDYLRRATYATSQGTYIADTLVIHPSTSGWAEYSPLDTGRTSVTSARFVDLIMALSSAQVDYDLGDEMLIGRHGSVEGKQFIVNKMAYTSVVVPSAVTLRAKTVELLNNFIAAGGKVIVMDPAPKLIDGEKPLKLKGMETAYTQLDVVKRLIPRLPSHVVVTPEDSGSTAKIYLHQRDSNGDRLLFFANTDNTQGLDTIVKIPLTGRVRQWNLFTGAVSDYPFTVEGKSTVLRLHFEPTASYLISVSPGEKPVDAKAALPASTRSQNLAETWKIAKQDLNSLTLDFIGCKRKQDADWAAPMPQYMIQGYLENKGPGTEFEIRYFFNSGIEPDSLKELYFVMEQPEMYELSLNGSRLAYSDTGWWRDKEFKKVDIKAVAATGKNEFKAGGKFVPPKIPGTLKYIDGGMEIEAAYVVGDFSIFQRKGQGYTIEPAVTSVKNGDLVKQGFPFFSGSITLSQDVDIAPAPGEKVFVEFDGLEAITTKVMVNGKDAGLIAFYPHRIEITPFLSSGVNKIEVELTNSNRNLMGPLHHYQYEPMSVGPGDFTQTATKKYNLMPFGITKGARIVFEKY